jgi:Flavin containing amine oxidoreductase
VPADAVVSTVPTPLVSALVPDLPAEWKQRYDSIHNIGVICVIFKLSRSVSPHFWVNVSEPDIEIPGVIEFTNLRPMGDDTVVYVPYYMPVTNMKFSWPDEQLVREAFACLQRINPAIAGIPPVQTPIAGLQIADTCYYYPEDRGIAESVRVGSEMANRIEEIAVMKLDEASPATRAGVA